jgi:hypothetical protein
MMIEGLSTVMERAKIQRLEEYKKAKHKGMVDKISTDNGVPQGFKKYSDKSKTTMEGKVKVEALD